MDVTTASYYRVRICARFWVAYRIEYPVSIHSTAFYSLDSALAWAEENVPIGESFIVIGRDDSNRRWTVARGEC